MSTQRSIREISTLCNFTSIIHHVASMQSNQIVSPFLTSRSRHVVLQARHKRCVPVRDGISCSVCMHNYCEMTRFITGVGDIS
eukprot:m.1296283 g.1296283  ORF g.1296283 m.1296283 type:complete len:83 (-) comp24794_c0_seq12:5873-6121(-)